MPASTLTLGPHLKLRGRVGVYVLGPASAATAKKKKGTSLRGRSFPTSAASWSAASFGRPSRWSC